MDDKWRILETEGIQAQFTCTGIGAFMEKVTGSLKRKATCTFSELGEFVRASLPALSESWTLVYSLDQQKYPLSLSVI